MIAGVRDRTVVGQRGMGREMLGPGDSETLTEC